MAAVESSDDALAAAGLYCSTSGTTFHEREALADHYKSDLHRYNLKRKVAGAPLSYGPCAAEQPSRQRTALLCLAGRCASLRQGSNLAFLMISIACAWINAPCSMRLPGLSGAHNFGKQRQRVRRAITRAPCQHTRRCYNTCAVQGYRR